jgi:hypothetical protein
MVRAKQRFVRLRVMIACLAVLISMRSDITVSAPVWRLPPLLQELSAPLDEIPVDVFGGAEVPKNGFKNPTLVPLSSYVWLARSSKNYKSSTWTKEFENGTVKYLLASIEKRRRATGPEEILSAWDSAVKNKKAVFISYAAEDADLANMVKSVIRSKGYVGFAFLSKAGALPTYDAEIAGKFFREATHHFVLDTPKARSSLGVRWEALLYSFVDEQKSFSTRKEMRDRAQSNARDLAYRLSSQGIIEAIEKGNIEIEGGAEPDR